MIKLDSYLFVGTRAPRIVAEPFTAKKTLKRKVDILFSGEELAIEFFSARKNGSNRWQMTENSFCESYSGVR